MRGLLFRKAGSLDNLSVEELPVPVPKAGEALVKVFAASINPIDTKNVLGMIADSQPPRIPGRDFAGRVVAGEAQWHGKLVFGTGGDLGFGRNGSHAEFVAVPIDGLVEMPPELSFERAAAIGLGYLTAFAALVSTGAIKKGETVLITGTTGTVGTAAAKIAAWKGARVLGTVRSSRDMGTRNDLSFVEWINLETGSLPQRVMELTSGKGADLILDVVGGPLFGGCLESLAQRGRQIAVAAAGNPQVTFDLVKFYRKEARLMGLNTLRLSFRESAEILELLLPGIREGVFSPRPEETVSLDEAIGAYREIVTGGSGKKFVIRFNKEPSEA